MTRSEIGKLGEDFVCAYLQKHGYTIMDRNYRIKDGEIDIIAADGIYLAFVEVKTRKPDSLVSGYDAINNRKKGLIIKMAADYCCKHPHILQPRFDTAQVIFDGQRIRSIDYIKNAFDTTGYKFIF
ncbi:MAG: YraN family protein [Ruminococcus sp.]|nr:YraN family protein [Ruminococcus sp.]